MQSEIASILFVIAFLLFLAYSIGVWIFLLTAFLENISNASLNPTQRWYLISAYLSSPLVFPIQLLRALRQSVDQPVRQIGSFSLALTIFFLLPFIALLIVARDLAFLSRRLSRQLLQLTLNFFDDLYVFVRGSLDRF